MKIETIENEKPTEWIVPCLVKYYLGGAIVLVTSASHDGFYSGFGVNTGDRYSIGDEYDSISPHDGWILYDGKVILNNN